MRDDLNRGLSIEIVWFDDDLLELRVRADNGRFAGSAELYAGHDALSRIADTLLDFPASREDRREIELGTFDPTYAGGGARLRLRTLDRAGHVVLEVQLRTDSHYGIGESGSAELSLFIEPSAIDDFVAALRGMGIEVGAGARLRQAT